MNQETDNNWYMSKLEASEDEWQFIREVVKSVHGGNEKIIETMDFMEGVKHTKRYIDGKAKENTNKDS